MRDEIANAINAEQLIVQAEGLVERIEEEEELETENEEKLLAMDFEQESRVLDDMVSAFAPEEEAPEEEALEEEAPEEEALKHLKRTMNMQIPFNQSLVGNLWLHVSQRRATACQCYVGTQINHTSMDYSSINLRRCNWAFSLVFE